jgi:hypothetical protein
MTTVSLRMPEDVVDDLERLVPRLGFTSYQAVAGVGLIEHCRSHSVGGPGCPVLGDHQYGVRPGVVNQGDDEDRGASGLEVAVTSAAAGHEVGAGMLKFSSISRHS